ncbi:lysozyme inhibitor LprI family protein [Roseovarius sp. 2305UL8-3]|uniref:lysozyme inhibitor LprI family protein n=1 Tax=Roseovarius conchicola TaxID=3121636 RepID=UPI003529B8EC
MFRYSIFFAVLSMPLSGPAGADAALECGVQVSSQVEIGSCVSAQVGIANQALAEALGFAQDAATELDEVTGREVAVPALVDAQSAWLTYRDAQCSYSAALLGGGSGAGITEGACHVALTRARIAELLGSL